MYDTTVRHQFTSAEEEKKAARTNDQALQQRSHGYLLWLQGLQLLQVRETILLWENWCALDWGATLHNNTCFEDTLHYYSYVCYMLQLLHPSI